MLMAPVGVPLELPFGHTMPIDTQPQYAAQRVRVEPSVVEGIQVQQPIILLAETLDDRRPWQPVVNSQRLQFPLDSISSLYTPRTATYSAASDKKARRRHRVVSAKRRTHVSRPMRDPRERSRYRIQGIPCCPRTLAIAGTSLKLEGAGDSNQASGCCTVCLK